MLNLSLFPKTLALIGCSKTKTPDRCQAEQLYSPSRLFRARLAYARSIGADVIRILSAEHHLVRLDEELDPYDVTLQLAENRRAWASVAGWEIAQLCSREAIQRVVVLCGRDYQGALSQITTPTLIPFDGLSIGKRYAAIVKHTEAG